MRLFRIARPGRRLRRIKPKRVVRKAPGLKQVRRVEHPWRVR